MAQNIDPKLQILDNNKLNRFSLIDRNRIFRKESDLEKSRFSIHFIKIFTAFLCLFIAWTITLFFGMQIYNVLAQADDVQINIYVWHDQNGNGLQDETAIIGLNNVTVRLYKAGETPTLMAIGLTDNDKMGQPGHTIFNTLPAGTYFAQFDLETLPLGYQLNNAHIGIDPITGVTASVDVEPTGTQNKMFVLGLVRQPDLVLVQTDGGASAAPGTTIRYTLAFDNQGDMDAEKVIISAIVPQHSHFSQSNSSPGWQCEDHALANTPCTFHIGRVLPHGTGSVIFAVEVESILGSDVLQIASNSFVSIHGSIEEAIVTNNRGGDVTPIGNLDEPTGTVNPVAIDLLSFVSLPQPGFISVEWRTGAEVDTFGFQLYRNTSSQREGASLVTDRVIPGQGDSGGYYTFTDKSVLPGVAYTYWLVELENETTIHEYGPVRSTIQAAETAPYQIFLPFVNR